MRTADVAAQAAEALRRVYETMDGGDLRSYTGRPPTKRLAKSRGAYIPFSRGEVQWILGVLYDDDAARSITRAMFAMEADEDVADGDMADALGEITNMAAGVLKGGLFPAEQRQFKLGLPRFVGGIEWAEILWGCEEFATWRLQDGGDTNDGDILVGVGRMVDGEESFDDPRSSVEGGDGP